MPASLSPVALLVVAILIGVVLAMIDIEPRIKKATSIAVVVLVVLAVLVAVLQFLAVL